VSPRCGQPGCPYSAAHGLPLCEGCWALACGIDLTKPSGELSVPARPPLPPVAPGTSALVARLLDPQPPPVGDGPSVTDEALRLVDDERIRELLRARREQGIARYGRELTAANGRDALADAAQEALDLLLYLVQLQMEGRGLILWPLAKVLRQIVDVAEDEEARALPHELPSMPIGSIPRDDYEPTEEAERPGGGE
jgi:hypothetical protein